jgi:hypothetical protein
LAGLAKKARTDTAFGFEFDAGDVSDAQELELTILKPSLVVVIFL